MKEPLQQVLAIHADRMFKVLTWAGTVTVDGNGSPILACIARAPSIKMQISAAAGSTRAGSHMPAISASAAPILSDRVIG